jgi:chromosome segregation protein
VASTTQQLAEREARLQALRVEVVASEKDRERLDEERARMTAELEVWVMEAGGLAGADDRAAEELAAIGSRLAAAEAEVSTRRAHLAERQLAIAAWRDTQGAAEQERTRRAVDLAAVIERRRAVEAELGRAREAARDVEARLLAIADVRRAAAAGADVAAAEACEADALGRAAAGRVAEVGSECEGLRVALAAATASLSADDEAERIARERLEGLRDTRGGLEVALTERRLAIEHLREQLNERYGLDVDALAAVPVEPDDEGDDRAARVEVLRLRLGQLGDVNPGALAELQDVMTRHGFLVEQRDDLERSLDDLRRTIGKLSRTSRERFAETFDAANAKLAEVFPKLFPGGQARLQLMEAEEGGEPGVEIVVQPSGKKLQHLSLLSGGEKALTATALVLSLFLIRPTPFCVLDEVDAPLDEANIGRFNQLVREMAENTQFVLITHNRRTMEVADTLYGITMEQPGLSKVVSVRLREAA